MLNILTLLHPTISIIRTIEALRIHHSLASLCGRIAIGFYQTTIVSSFLLLVLTSIRIYLYYTQYP
jgi:hypothetical protein